MFWHLFIQSLGTWQRLTNLKSLQSGYLNFLNSRNHLSGRDDFADIDALSKCQIVWMKKPKTPVGQDAIAENIQKRSFYVPSLVVRQNTHRQNKVQGDVRGQLYRQVVTHAAIRLEIGVDFQKQLFVVLFGVQGINGHQRLVPTSRPAQGTFRSLKLLKWLCTNVRSELRRFAGLFFFVFALFINRQCRIGYY